MIWKQAQGSVTQWQQEEGGLSSTVLCMKEQELGMSVVLDFMLQTY